MKPSFKRHGFTLVEVLVVITIIVVLAGVVFTVARTMKQRAAASKSLSDVRQTGTILLAKATETNGRCRFFQGGSGNFDYRPYFIVMNELEVATTNVLEIMHAGQPPESNAHWNCRAVNFTDLPNLGAVWTRESVKDGQNRSGNIWALVIANVSRPSAYPLFIDSSTSSGDEIFRINEGNGDCVGLRSNGKANALMLDGSARAMDKADLKAVGFSKAYDNATKPPKSIRL